MDLLRHPIEALRERWPMERDEFRRDPAGYLAGMFMLVVFGPICLVVTVGVVAAIILSIVGVI